MEAVYKGRYGLRAMIDLALYAENTPVSIASIAARQHISGELSGTTDREAP